MDDIIETTLKVGDSFEYKREQFRYLGNVQDPNDLPNCNCFYSIGDTLHIRTVEKPINLEVKPEDSVLLAFVKEIYKAKGYTSRREFRKLFDSESEANIMLRAIEDGTYLTYSIFELLVTKLGLKFKVYTEYENGDRSSEEHIEEKPKKKYKRHNRNNDPYCKQGHISSRFVSSIAQHSF